MNFLANRGCAVAKWFNRLCAAGASYHFRSSAGLGATHIGREQ
jgi:hypothetical protein